MYRQQTNQHGHFQINRALPPESFCISMEYARIKNKEHTCEVLAYIKGKKEQFFWHIARAIVYIDEHSVTIRHVEPFAPYGYFSLGDLGSYVYYVTEVGYWFPQKQKLLQDFKIEYK